MGIRKRKRQLPILLLLALLMFSFLGEQLAIVEADDSGATEYKASTFVDSILMYIRNGEQQASTSGTSITQTDVLKALKTKRTELGEKEFDDYLDALILDSTGITVEQQVSVRGLGKLKRDTNKFLETGLIVYGGPEDVKKNEANDLESGQYRYLGYDASGNKYLNMDFPADAEATYDVGDRNWLPAPWDQVTSTIHNTTKPAKTDYMYDYNYSRKERAAWLDRIIDKYANSSEPTRGNFDPTWTGSKLVDYAMIQQAPTPVSPGQVTMWHRRYDGDGATRGYDFLTNTNRNYKDWYDTFYLEPTEDILGKLLLVVQYWDDLMVTHRWVDPPAGSTWPNAGSAQPAGTPVTLQANVKVEMPRIGNSEVQEVADKYAKDNLLLDYYQLNGAEVVDTEVYWLDANFNIIGMKPVVLTNQKPQTVSLNWKFPTKSQKLYVMVVPAYEKNPSFLEYELSNNFAALDIQVAPGGGGGDDTPSFASGLDNLKMTALIPQPGNGGKPAGEQINYRSVVKAELPTNYVRVSFNGGAKSNPIPLYSEVSTALTNLGNLDHVSVDSSGSVTASQTYENWEYISDTCSTTTKDKDGKNVTTYFECGGYGYVTRNNPNYATAESTVSSLTSTWANVKATVTVQGQTCNLTLIRGGSEESCVIAGTMPATESRLKSVVSGTGIKETTLTDNTQGVTMYPIDNVENITSTGKTDIFNIDPKTGAATKNTNSNPAKYGQEVQIKVGSTAGIEQVENKWGYRIHRMCSQYANTVYGTGTKKNVPVSSSFGVSGNTPSASHYSISKQSTDNKTWTGDFKNTASGGTNIPYIYDVTRVEKSYGGFTWYEYETFWANKTGTLAADGSTKSSVVAKVQTNWETKTDSHWIVDLVARPGTDPIGYWTQYGTLPPLKNGVPTPIKEGGKMQSVAISFNYKYNDISSGVVTKVETGVADVLMFSTLVTSVGSGQ